MSDFEITSDHRRWARARQRDNGGSTGDYVELIQLQQGVCIFSGVPLLFDSRYGTSKTGGPGCHPLYASLDHCAPGGAECWIVCYALNDLKGHIPAECFDALRKTAAWKRLMERWYRQFARNWRDREAFYALLRPKAD